MGMVLRMEQGAILQHQLPIHTDYTLPAEGDCADACAGHTHHHEAYGPTASVDTLRRENPLTQHIPASFTYASAQSTAGARFVPDRGIGEANSYQATGNFTDSSSGSISTSPSSAASSLTYTNYPGNHYTTLQTFPGPVQLPQAFVPSTFHTARSSSLFDGSTQPLLPPPGRSSISTLPNAADRDAFAAAITTTTNPASTPYLARSQLTPANYPAYPSYPETPRSVVHAAAGLSLSPGAPLHPYHMATASPHGYGTQSNECANFPWSDIDVLVDMNCEGQLLVPKIHAKVEKGFFPSHDKKWTCYRRNYFSVACSFEIRPTITNGRVTIRRNGTPEPVQAMGMRLSAAVDGPEGKSIELIQHTPKRDAGPKTKIDICKVAPTPSPGRVDQGMSSHAMYQVSMPTYHPTGQVPGPYLPLQNNPEGDTQAGAPQTPQVSSQYPYVASSPPSLIPGQNTAYTFERVQFKQATANNGKRRATQQYFHLIVELFADVRKDGSDKPVWVKVAQRVSDKIVVRGRSPSHYQGEKNDPTHGSAGRGGSAGGSGGYGNVGGPAYTSMNAGGFRGLTSAYGTHVSGGGNTYRSKCDMPFSDNDGSQSGSSSSSIDGGHVDADYPMDTVMSDADRLALHEHEGYQYYPSTMYEGVHHGHALPPLSKPDVDSRYPTDPRHYAVKAEFSDAVAGAQYQAGNCGRFQGVESSRGYFPDLQAGYP